MGATWNTARVVDTKNKSLADHESLEKPQSIRDSLNAEAKARMELFDVEVPTRLLDDLVVPLATKEQIIALIAKIQNHEVLYQDWGLAEIDPYRGRTAINLYGPPGTGKSFCAEAIANQIGLGIIRVNYAEIESKYVGETPKNIKAAFTKAGENKAILFFDEADSILGKRLTNVTQSADHGVNVSRSVMLLELDRFDGITIFATNLASNYDSAFVRRIIGHIEMPLPDYECRQRLWKQHIPSKMPTNPYPFTILDFSGLAQESEGLSGGDILNAVINAATYAVQRDKPHREVRLDDLLRAILTIKKAKEEVGQSSFSRKIVPLSETSKEVIEAYKANTASKR